MFSEPAAKGRIKGDGNCFFRALAFLITGSQDDHNELRLLTTTYMSHQAASLSCYLKESEIMKSYLERTRMHCPTVWATEVEIFSAAQMLDTDIFVFDKSGHCHKWLRFQSSVATDNCSYKHSKQSLYLTNRNNHFETVKRM